MVRIFLATAVAGLALGVAAPRTAHAAFVATMQQVGNDVVVDGSGSLFLGALSAATPRTATGGQFLLGRPSILVGPAAAGDVDVRFGATVPAWFGSGDVFRLADFGSGDFVGAGSMGQIFVPRNYTSNDPLTSSMTFRNQTLASLGAVEGTYVWSWGNIDQGTFDTFSVTILAPDPPTAVPAPPALALFGVGLVGLAAARRGRG